MFTNCISSYNNIQGCFVCVYMYPSRHNEIKVIILILSCFHDIRVDSENQITLFLFFISIYISP